MAGLAVAFWHVLRMSLRLAWRCSKPPRPSTHRPAIPWLDRVSVRLPTSHNPGTYPAIRGTYPSTRPLAFRNICTILQSSDQRRIKDTSWPVGAKALHLSSSMVDWEAGGGSPGVKEVDDRSVASRKSQQMLIALSNRLRRRYIGLLMNSLTKLI